MTKFHIIYSWLIFHKFKSNRHTHTYNLWRIQGGRGVLNLYRKLNWPKMYLKLLVYTKHFLGQFTEPWFIWSKIWKCIVLHLSWKRNETPVQVLDPPIIILVTYTITFILSYKSRFWSFVWNSWYNMNWRTYVDIVTWHWHFTATRLVSCCELRYTDTENLKNRKKYREGIYHERE